MIKGKQNIYKKNKNKLGFTKKRKNKKTEKNEK